MQRKFVRLVGWFPGVPAILILVLAANVAGQKPGRTTKPTAVAVVVRQIDQIVERCIIDPAYWEATTDQTKAAQEEYDTCLQTIDASALLDRAVKLKLRVQSVRSQDDGTIEVSGTAKVRSKPTEFYRTTDEKKELRDFQEETRRIKEDHQDRIVYLQNRITYHKSRHWNTALVKREMQDEHQAYRRKLKDRPLELAAVNRRINGAAGNRKDAYERVDVQIVISPPYSSKINIAKLALAKRAHFVVQLERLALQRPIDDIGVLPLVGAVEAECIEIEDKFRLP